ncbi:MAG: DNA-processing protein DprA [Bacteroidota bacterium]
MDQERLSFLALHFTPGVGDQLIKQLVGYCGSASEVFKKPKGKLLKVPGIGNVTAEAILNGKPIAAAENELRTAEKEEAELLLYYDKKYPERLRAIDDAPSLLYWKGNINLNHPKTIGIVGTRQATDYGKQAVEKIIEDLIPHQVLVISGLAYGIDIQAHKQALKKNLNTVGVMGSGLDVIYPAAHKETARKMVQQGGLLTENHFGTKPDAHNFPARNRIIAGMCDALIVVEAAQTGGALITADIANSYNKDVFAVPGGIGQTYSEGCNKLIKTNRAHLFTSVQDLEFIMSWKKDGDATQKDVFSPASWNDLNPEEKAVLTVMKQKDEPIQIDELAWKSAMPQGVLASMLLNLEFKNLVQSMPGKLFRLVR